MTALLPEGRRGRRQCEKRTSAVSIPATTVLLDDEQRVNEAAHSDKTRPISRRDDLILSVNVSDPAGTTAKSRSSQTEMMEVDIMASVEKYTAGSVSYELRHNTREDPHPSSNKEIDPERTPLNYHLDDRGETAREARDYYNARMKELSCYDRKDINVICQWVCTAPKDLPPEQEKAFFKETYNFLNNLYGEKNCIQAVVHRDEGVKDREGKVVEGQAHLHYIFIPVVENSKFDPAEKAAYFEKLEKFEERRSVARSHHEPFNRKEPVRKVSTYEEKVCADQVIRTRTLREFHPQYQEHLNKAGIHATVHSGVTKGKNRTVSQLKEETKEHLAEKARLENRITDLEAKLNDQISLNKELSAELEKEKSRHAERDVWGDSTDAWGDFRDRKEKDIWR